MHVVMYPGSNIGICIYKTGKRSLNRADRNVTRDHEGQAQQGGANKGVAGFAPGGW